MSDIGRVLNTAKQAILSELTAINTTGSNIANVNTPNYSRLTPIFSTVGGGIGSDREQAGVEVKNIERVYDRFLEAQVVGQEQNVGYSDTLKSSLDRVEAVINESETGGLNDLLSKFWSAWSDLAANPSGTAERDVLIETSQSLASQFQQQGNALLSIQQDMDDTIVNELQNVNTMTSTLSDYNAQIMQIEMNGGSANDLRDKRQDLLTQLSNKLDIQYYEDARGSLNVYLSNGKALVQGDTNWNLEAVSNPSNSNYSDIVVSGSTESLNSSITGGKIGALLDLRDTTLPSYISRLDTLAENFVNKVNSQHQLGYNAYQNLGGNFFNPTTTARGVSLDAALAADSRKIAASSTVNGDGDNATAIGSIKDALMCAAVDQPTLSNAASGASITIDRPTQAYKATVGAFTLTRGANASTWSITNNGGYSGLTILAADADSVTLDLNGSGNTDMTIALSGTWNAGDTVTFGLIQDDSSSTLNDFYSALSSLVGQNVKDATTSQDRQAAVASQLQSQREAVSGVSIDEEMMNLMKYQAAYNAAGRLVTTVSEMMDILINLGK